MPVVLIAVQNGAVLCGRDGGNVRRSRDPKVTWRSDHAVTLEFFLIHEEGEEAVPGSVKRRWPFEEPEPADGVVTFKGSSKAFTIRAARDPGEQRLYKYSVKVETNAGEFYKLDPIIIMD